MDTSVFTGEHALVDLKLTDEEIKLCATLLELEVLCESQEIIEGTLPPVGTGDMKSSSLAKAFSILKIARSVRGAEALLIALKMAPAEARLAPLSFANFLLFLLRVSAPTLKLPEPISSQFKSTGAALAQRLEALGAAPMGQKKEESNTLFNPSIVGLA
jgi:hypothetical protein